MRTFLEFVDTSKMSDADVLRKIMVMELDTVNDYEKMLRKCSDPKVIKQIKDIIQEEKVHCHEMEEILYRLDPSYRKAQGTAKEEL